MAKLRRTGRAEATDKAAFGRMTWLRMGCSESNAYKRRDLYPVPQGHSGWCSSVFDYGNLNNENLAKSINQETG